MSAATGIDVRRGREPAVPFPWRKHVIHGAVLALILLATKITDYVCGTRLNGLSIVSPMFPLTIAALVFALVVLIRTIWGFSLAFAGRVPRRKIALLALPAATAFAVMALPIPGFHRAVAGQIQEKASREEWIGMARALLDSPPAWLNDSTNSWRESDWQWLAATSPIDRLTISRPPYVSLRSDTVQFSWGGALAHGWGIAISGTSGKKPVFPEGSRNHLAIYPEIWVFNLFD
jgi:hypothetical protein